MKGAVKKSLLKDAQDAVARQEQEQPRSAPDTGVLPPPPSMTSPYDQVRGKLSALMERLGGRPSIEPEFPGFGPPSLPGESLFDRPGNPLFPNLDFPMYAQRSRTPRGPTRGDEASHEITFRKFAGTPPPSVVPPSSLFRPEDLNPGLRRFPKGRELAPSLYKPIPKLDRKKLNRGAGELEEAKFGKKLLRPQDLLKRKRGLPPNELEGRDVRQDAFRRPNPFNPKNWREPKPPDKKGRWDGMIENLGKKLGLPKEWVDFAKEKAPDLEQMGKEKAVEYLYETAKEYAERGKKPANRPSITDGSTGPSDPPEHWTPDLGGAEKHIPPFKIQGKKKLDTGKFERDIKEMIKKMRKRLFHTDEQREPLP
ncbi:hypothetical protein ACFL2Q_02405 [Thermodesulfobacteriota bacterium]